MRRSLVLALGIATLLLAWESARSEEMTRAALVGEWRHVGGAEEQQRVREAVETCVSEMGFLVRPLARRRLLDGSRIPAHLEIEAGASWASVVEDHGAPFAAPLGRAAKRVSRTGEPIDLRHVATNDGLVQWRTGEQGSSRIIYRLVDGGRRLVTDVQTTSHLLPQPVRYRLTYERAR